MTQDSRPWNGVTTGDAGPYSDGDWQQLYRYIIGLGGNRNNVGVFLGSGTQPNEGLRVTAQSPVSAFVDVNPGAALVHGIAYLNDAVEAISVAVNASGSARIDTVVIRTDYALQTCRLAILTGTPAGSPVPPSLTQTANVLWEIPIADIAVANGFTTLAQSTITSRREWVNAASGVYLDNVLNNSGVVLQDGDVVVWDNTANRSMTTTTTQDNRALMGVVRGRVEIGEYGRVQTKGIGYVNANAAVTIGNILTTSTTTKQAVSFAASTTGIANAVLGRALETTTGAGFVLTHIDVHVVRNVDIVIVQDQKTSGTAGGATVATTWTTHILNTEVVDTAGIAAIASNLVTLQPGHYTAEWAMTIGTNPGINRTRLRNTTANTTLGQSVNALGTAMSAGVAEFELTVASDIALQYYAAAVQAAGLGNALSTGDVEVYATIKFTRHSEVP
jgi:hypothetical protein